MEPERRRHIRHIPLKQNAFAALGHNFAKTGKIKDISLVGLSIEYIVDRCIQTNEGSRVDIFLTDMPLHIRNAQCQTIYDNCMPQTENYISNSLTVRRTGIKFIMLSETQRSQLIFLINFFCKARLRQIVKFTT